MPPRDQGTKDFLFFSSRSLAFFAAIFMVVTGLKKEQLAYYAGTLGLKEAVYLVFVPNSVKLAGVREQKETIKGIVIDTFIVLYDEKKDF